jgi:hypothetical protein
VDAVKERAGARFAGAFRIDHEETSPMKNTLLHVALGAAFLAVSAAAPVAYSAPPVNSMSSAKFNDSAKGPPPTAPGHNKLKCFDGPSEGTVFGGLCTVGRGAMGPATLDVSSDDPDGDYAGVYYLEGSMYGGPLGAIKQLGYHYIADDDEIVPGNLSLNIPIDEDGDGVTEGYAFIDAFYCPGSDGVVDVLHDEVCGIFYLGVEYDNWDALVAAFPDALVATDNFAFVIAERTPTDGPATYRVNAVKIGKPGK